MSSRRTRPAAARRRPLLLLLALALPLAAACGGGEGDLALDASWDSGLQGAAVALEGSEWVLTSLEGRPPLAGSRVTLRFTGETAGGYGGCNWYGSGVTVAGARITFGGAQSTQRLCGEPAGVVAQEQRYFDALRRAARYRVLGGERLELGSSAGATLAIYTRRVPAPMDPAALAGTSWRLHAVDDTVQTASPPATLALTAGEISGFAGCREYTGSYQARGDEIRVTSIAMRSTDCAAGDAALLREGHFTTDLSESSNYRLTADTLEILTFPGRRLLFVARR
jgi:heat shock protein HslJ